MRLVKVKVAPACVSMSHLGNRCRSHRLFAAPFAPAQTDEADYSHLAWLRPQQAVKALCSARRNQDLKEMLESNKESLKLEAMKRIVGVSAQTCGTDHENGEMASGWSCFCFVLLLC